MHLSKFTRQQSGHMFQHYERSKECPSADPAKKELNYNLAAKIQPLEQQEFLRKRIAETKRTKKIRKDAVAVCDWITTAPKDLPKEEEDKFFQAAYDKLVRQYGEDNVVSAWVHKDEQGSSHMHFAFVPIVKDKATGFDKLCAKEAITRASLKKMHPDMEKYVSEKLGHEVHLLTGELSNRPDLTLPQYKALKEIEKQIGICDKKLSEMVEKIDSYKYAFDKIQDIENIDPKQGTFGIKNITIDEIKELQVRASKAISFEQETVDLIKKIRKLEKMLPSFDESLEQQKLQNEIERLRASNKVLQDELKKYGYSERQIENMEKLHIVQENPFDDTK